MGKPGIEKKSTQTERKKFYGQKGVVVRKRRDRAFRQNQRVDRWEEVA